MSWLSPLVDGNTVVGIVMLLALVISSGLALGNLKLRGVGLGIAGVLFSGLAFGHFGFRIEERILEFAREFGLVLFVYSIGIQVGPGFLASLRRAGLPQNLMAVAVVVSGVLIALAVHWVGGVEAPALVGLLSGATTNTPSLAAGQQALLETTRDPELRARLATLPGMGYAVAYPFGVLGVILSMLAIRTVFRISLEREHEAHAESLEGSIRRVSRANLEVTNPNLSGMALAKVPTLASSGMVISRIYHDGRLEVPKPETVLAAGDVLLAVGSPEELEALRVVVGRESPLDLRTLPSAITTRRMIVTRAQAANHTLATLDFVRRFGVQITRVGRAEVELGTHPGFELHYGDTVLAVGEPDGLDRVAAELGDSPRSLNYPHLIPMFLGIALGVVLGSYPVSLPGLPAPVKLGMAGGPLLAAIALSRIGRIGPLVWYMPMSANYLLREIGIVLFLAAVGLRSGGTIVSTLTKGPGLQWLAWGAAITVIPLLLVGLLARALFRVNYLTLTGLLAGSMTDPPALAFANTLAGTEAPALAYVAVYPLTMILRVLSAQVLVFVLG